MTDSQRSLKAKFTSADADGDGYLNRKEFGSFVHPQRHDHMVQHLIKDQLHTYDKNQDGIISRREYLGKSKREGGREREGWREGRGQREKEGGREGWKEGGEGWKKGGREGRGGRREGGRH